MAHVELKDTLNDKQNTKMEYGIRNMNKVADNQDVCQCTNCNNYYYDEINDERDNNSLTFLYNDDEPYKGCPVCKTDEFLMDVDITEIV